ELESEQGDSDCLVIGAGRQPFGLMTAGHQPPARTLTEAHMVALAGVAVDLLLIVEVLTPAAQQQRGHRRLRIAALHHRRTYELAGRGRSDAVGEDPARRPHRMMVLSFLTAPGDVDRVREQTVGRASPADEVLRQVDLRPNAVESWESE